MFTTRSTKQAKFQEILPLVRLSQPARWSPSRVVQRLLAITGLDAQSAIFMLLVGTAIVVFVVRGIPGTALMTEGSGLRLSTAQPPGVHFLSESRSLFDSVPPDSMVQVCAYVIDIEHGEPVVMVDRRTFTIRQMQTALRIVAVLESSSPEPAASPRQPSLELPPITAGVVVAQDVRPRPSPE
jgi:hypothetical protein